MKKKDRVLLEAIYFDLSRIVVLLEGHDVESALIWGVMRKIKDNLTGFDPAKWWYWEEKRKLKEERLRLMDEAEMAVKLDERKNELFVGPIGGNGFQRIGTENIWKKEMKR